MGKLSFQTVLQPRGPAAAVILTEAQVAEVGEGAKKFPVVASINGYTWRHSVMRMGGEFMLGLRREVREAAGVEAGDEVQVILELDCAPRTVEPPADLLRAFDQETRALFERLSYTHRKEFVNWLEEAKRPETRARRLRATLDMLRQGRKL
jgi:hypothetical protein